MIPNVVGYLNLMLRNGSQSCEVWGSFQQVPNISIIKSAMMPPSGSRKEQSAGIKALNDLSYLGSLSFQSSEACKALTSDLKVTSSSLASPRVALKVTMGHPSLHHQQLIAEVVTQ
ncbi:hypothetical protein TNCV_3938581 [Trichonephila clavipes]|nr:hypothetical protein TNCV_3938581 [Trichonephila clavipes]